jgi:hypothetical protein
LVSGLSSLRWEPRNDSHMESSVRTTTLAILAAPAASKPVFASAARKK